MPGQPVRTEVKACCSCGQGGNRSRRPQLPSPGPRSPILSTQINRAYRGSTGEEGEGGFNPEMAGVIGYMISDSAEQRARVLTDGDNRPLWVPSTREGLPNSLNGYPYVVNGHMAAVATGAVPMLFRKFQLLRNPHGCNGRDFPVHGQPEPCSGTRLRSWPSAVATDGQWARLTGRQMRGHSQAHDGLVLNRLKIGRQTQ